MLQYLIIVTVTFYWSQWVTSNNITYYSVPLADHAKLLFYMWNSLKRWSNYGLEAIANTYDDII